MPIVYTGKYLTEEDNKSALFNHREQTGVASGMVITDRGRWPKGATCPRTEGEIARQRYLKIVNDGAVAAGLDPPREFIDEDGDEAVNNYGVDFSTREILLWEESETG